MRLWHKDLIPVLPRQQLLGQWRECCAIMSNIAKNGTPNHVLVNKVMEYSTLHLHSYAVLIRDEMMNRGYKCDFNKFLKKHEDAVGTFLYPALTTYPLDVSRIFPRWHNNRYLAQCYYNLQEKYDCGAITDEEWTMIDERYRELTGGSGA